ncbi:hypothetical protein LY76DRAFT_391347 [Colletotrichum caudatum]|nr:hypothetical protein LY76DRAFT_391347 [Colletotrichum caudatum]
MGTHRDNRPRRSVGFPRVVMLPMLPMWRTLDAGFPDSFLTAIATSEHEASFASQCSSRHAWYNQASPQCCSLTYCSRLACNRMGSPFLLPPPFVSLGPAVSPGWTWFCFPLPFTTTWHIADKTRQDRTDKTDRQPRADRRSCLAPVAIKRES